MHPAHDRLLACAVALASGVASVGLAVDADPQELFAAAVYKEAAAAPAVPALTAEDPEWVAMTHNLTRLALSYRGQVGIYLKDLSSGREWGWREERSFPAASLVKVPVMAAVFQRVQEGGLRLSTRVKLKRRDRQGGSGNLKWFRDGSEFPVRELLLRMMRDSDNTAMQMLIRTVGLEHVRRNMREAGLERTTLDWDGFSLTSQPVRNENLTTPREMALLFEKIHRGELVDPYSSGLMTELMGQGQHRTRLSRDLPPDWEMAHKTGLLRRACHDVGLIKTPKGTFVLAVMTKENASYGPAKSFISRVGAAAYRYYEGGYSLYAMVPPEAR